MGSEGCVGALGSSDESGEAARRLLNVVTAGAAELGWGTGKANLVLASGGLNKLLEGVDGLDKSAPVESLPDFKTAPKLNCAAGFPVPVSPKVNEAAVGLGVPSLASAP